MVLAQGEGKVPEGEQVQWSLCLHKTRGLETFPSETTHTKTADLTADKSCVMPNISKWHHKLLMEFKLTGLLKLRRE